jgi:transcriptional regulator with XRE-family HTH domain
VTPRALRSKRTAAGIVGQSVCQIAGISRAKLSDIEREYVAATSEELQRIDAAINQILNTKEHVARLATEAGLSLIGVRL